MAKKERLDILMHQRGLAPSREKARAMIMAAEVMAAGQMIDKPGTRVDVDTDITVKSRPPFVSRGGEKLAGALEQFDIEVTGRICADVGASTGGFTDCLLQQDAAQVYAIDVGYGQIAHEIRIDERVTLMERTNARYLDKLAEPVSLVVIDVSFISLRLILPAVKKWLAPQADIVTLIKPQFEAGRQDVGKGGVIRDAAVHRRVLEDILDFTDGLGFNLCGLITSPIKGATGNVEFLAWLRWGQPCATSLSCASAIAALSLPDTL